MFEFSYFPTSLLAAYYFSLQNLIIIYSSQGNTISGAIKYAVEKINNCSSILEDVELDFLYTDTEGDVFKSSAILVDHICNDIAAFIGPEGPTCSVEATVAASKNRTMISYGCSDPEVSDKTR